MSATYEVIGSLPDNLRVAVALDGSAVALVRATDGEANGAVVQGPFALEAIRKTAEQALMGHARTLASTKAMAALALFTASQFLYAERAARAQGGSSPVEDEDMAVSPKALNQMKAQGYRLIETFSGPPGSGKTHRARALVKSLRSEGYDAVHTEDERDNSEAVYARKVSHD